MYLDAVDRRERVGARLSVGLDAELHVRPLLHHHLHRLLQVVLLRGGVADLKSKAVENCRKMEGVIQLILFLNSSLFSPWDCTIKNLWTAEKEKIYRSTFSVNISP